MQKVVLVTGASSGVGLALCKRLLEEDEELHVCLACRNVGKAEAVRAALLASHPTAEVSVVQVDVSNVQSVIRAARELKQRFQRLDYVYLNAGIMPNPQLNFRALFSGLFSRKVIHMFSTAEGLLTQEDKVTADGLQEVFETNVFGHFILIRELEPLLCHSDSPSQLIWTSSRNARKSNFHLEDIQHSSGQEPYSSSKYAIDLLSVALNRNFNPRGLYSSVVCPGTMVTNMTCGILPPFVWTLLMPIIWLLRFFANAFTLTPYNGTEALVWLFHQQPESLNPLTKYLSATTGFGSNYVTTQKVCVGHGLYARHCWVLRIESGHVDVSGHLRCSRRTELRSGKEAIFEEIRAEHLSELIAAVIITSRKDDKSQIQTTRTWRRHRKPEKLTCQSEDRDH